MVEFYLAIFIMLASAWLLGEALHRMGQPALVGQLLAGVIIGPSILNVVQPTVDLSTVENVALFFIMLLTGLAVRPAKIIAAGKRGAVISSVAFVIPFIAGFEIARLFGTGLVSSLTIGLTISITAVPVNTMILMELGLLDTELGATVIAAGVIDDIISFIVLSMIQQFSAGGSVAGITTIVVGLTKVLVFLGVLFVLEHYLRSNSSRVRNKMEWLTSHMRTPGSYFAFLLICTVGVSLLAEWSGMQLVIGAFFAGFLLSEVIGDERLRKADEIVRGTTIGFFAPIAFTFIGTEFVLRSITGIPVFVAALLIAAIASKLLGGTLAAKVVKFTNSESITIGFLMNSRGFVELVIASTAFSLGLIDQSLFSLVVGVGIITTILSPIATRIILARRSLQTPVPMPNAKTGSDPETY